MKLKFALVYIFAISIACLSLPVQIQDGGKETGLNIERVDLSTLLNANSLEPTDEVGKADIATPTTQSRSPDSLSSEDDDPPKPIYRFWKRTVNLGFDVPVHDITGNFKWSVLVGMDTETRPGRAIAKMKLLPAASSDTAEIGKWSWVISGATANSVTALWTVKLDLTTPYGNLVLNINWRDMFEESGNLVVSSTWLGISGAASLQWSLNGNQENVPATSFTVTM